MEWTFKTNTFCIIVILISDGFSNFRDAFPEWCEDDSTNTDSQTSRAQAEQLMGLKWVFCCYFFSIYWKNLFIFAFFVVFFL